MENKILLGDTFIALDNINTQFNLIVTSPPYNVGKEYEVKRTLLDYLSWQESIIKKLYLLCMDTGSIVYQVGNYIKDGEVFPLDIYFYDIFKKLGMKLRNRVIWHFDHGLHCKHRLSGRYETFLWFTKSDNYTFNLDSIRVPSKYPNKKHYKGSKKGLLSGNPLGKNPSDYWGYIKDEFDCGLFDIPNVKHNHVEKTTHPCSFPIQLIERWVLALTNEYDLILDPFCGVGSSGIAALKHNRYFYCIDNNENYINIFKERINMFNKNSLKIRSDIPSNIIKNNHSFI